MVASLIDTNNMTAPTAHNFQAPDGAALAYYALGAPDSRPLMLIHGLFSNAHVNWIKYGHAALLAEAGFRVIMPDLRAHGASAKPHDAAAYPPDVLADDGLALIAHLGLSEGEYDLGGFSLGARTVVRMLAGGAKPGKAIIAGMGLSGITDVGPRNAHFAYILDHLGSFARGTPEWTAEQFLRTMHGDPVALRLLLGSSSDTTHAEVAAITTPCAIICGTEDNDNGSAQELAALLPDARFMAIPGTHMSCVVGPALGEAIRDFLRS